jgi:glycerol-3-phosphate acyltransferase PlsY
MKGLDIRTVGSGNIGATNVFRVIGKSAGITVFVLDFLKGFVPVMAAQRAVTQGVLPEWSLVFLALAAILGHNYTFWLGFRGGKGIATSAGAIVALLPVAVGIATVVWIVLMLLTRYVAVASLGAAITIPVVVVAIGMRGDVINLPLLGFSILVMILAFVRHRTNIVRLMEGSEHRFGSRRERESTGEGGDGKGSEQV